VRTEPSQLQTLRHLREINLNQSETLVESGLTREGLDHERQDIFFQAPSTDTGRHIHDALEECVP
jgi:hypothetical protein